VEPLGWPSYQTWILNAGTGDRSWEQDGFIACAMHLFPPVKTMGHSQRRDQ